jgi:hypothetical protein
MYIWSCEKRQFVDFLSSRKTLNQADIKSIESLKGLSVRGESLLLIWKQSPKEFFLMPSAIVVAENNKQDFLAWVSTYFRHIRPFTAHCRILTEKTIGLLLQESEAKNLPDFRAVEVGLIIAEGVAYSAGFTNYNRLPLSAFSRTLSFVYSEGIHKYGNQFLQGKAIIEHINEGWDKARRLSNQMPLSLDPLNIYNVWETVLCAVCGKCSLTNFTPDSLLVEALQGVMADGKISQDVWKLLYGDSGRAESLVSAMDGPREGRVKTIDAELRDLASAGGVERKYRAFLAGYLASRIQPGSLDHFPVLLPALKQLPESFLWYGACSGLMPETTVNNYGNGLGWLMMRELGRPSCWLDSPDCDISLLEMETLFQSREDSKISLPTVVSGILKVEIFPLVSTNIKWSESFETQSEKYRQTESQGSLFRDDNELRNDVMQVLRMLEDNRLTLNAIKNKVEKKFGEKLPSKRGGKNHRG